MKLRDAIQQILSGNHLSRKELLQAKPHIKSILEEIERRLKIEVQE
jgi:hypothetical protein